MTTNIQEQLIQTFEIVKQEEIAAPIGIVFETILEQMGPFNSTPEKPMPMILEAWPGGRWYRDLSDNSGHFWGVVQAIKPPTLLEIAGPLFMSTPAISNLQYRLSAVDGGTLIAFRHSALGFVSEEHKAGMGKGWSSMNERVRKHAEGSRK